jgi:hypothetical protein
VRTCSRDVEPLKGFDVYVVGFHCARDDPQMQMEAHHFCRVVNDDFLQCVIFDGNTRDANLIGIEYIVSEALFETLPEDERARWHPHTFELLSGQLVAPGLPDIAERAFQKRHANSYGKTWHTWHTGRHDQGPGDPLPLGDPMLMWSFNRDGEVDESRERDFTEAFDIDVERKRRERADDLLDLVHPQHGVDLLRDAFPDATPLRGVVDVRSAPRE